MNEFIESLEMALAERVNMLLMEMQNNPKASPSHAEVKAALAAFRDRISTDRPLYDQFDDLFSLLLSYSSEETRACYLQGIRDFRMLMLGTFPFALGKRE